ncbi:enoyl-CoA hydratase/isomerase family protein [Dactylosporangium sp. CA-152071]|uniref:enoyl-CoA hydratase/isomerase family protein n=1 Tax=Dactylosporangium sp. CA-152071 TaxID=3239933 RepID=UPI003D92EED4
MRVLELNDPRHRNPLTVRLRAELCRAIEAARDSAHCRSIVLTGSGGHFCSGGDIHTMSQDTSANQARMQWVTRLVETIAGSPLPIVAAVEGAAFGAGMGLALASDYVVAAEQARFCASFGAMGLGPDGGLSWTLPRVVGLLRARRLLLFGDVVSAAEAQAMGMVNEVCAAGTAMDIAVERATALAQRSASAVAAAKTALHHASNDLHAALDRESLAQVGLMAGADFAEGLSAFRAKRRPQFPTASATT